MSRVFLIVMDSVGCGGAPDAKDFGDEGACTLGNIIADASDNILTTILLCQCPLLCLCLRACEPAL